MKAFYLKNKDEIVAKIIFGDGEFDNDEIKAYEILSSQLLPKGIKESSFKKDFANWLGSRISRRASGYWYDKKVNALLSLNDCYYVLKASDERTWDELSLYRNKWNKNVQAAAINGREFNINSSALSPEFCTDGMLRKCWIKENDKIKLVKSQNQSSLQARGEFLASQVAKAMDLECVKYELSGIKDCIENCICENFCDEKIGFVAIWRLLESNANYEQYARAARELFGAERFDDMIIFDALIANKDRHYGNFGFLIDNDTNEILRPAPIFDSGYCAFRHRELWQLSRQWLEIEQNRTYGLSMNSALKLSMSERHIKMLEKLYDFSFEKSELIDDDELEKYENFVRNNARNIIRVIESRNF